MRFFGDEDHAWMVPGKILAFREHCTQHSTPKRGNTKGFKAGLKQAQKIMVQQEAQKSKNGSGVAIVEQQGAHLTVLDESGAIFKLRRCDVTVLQPIYVAFTRSDSPEMVVSAPISRVAHRLVGAIPALSRGTRSDYRQGALGKGGGKGTFMGAVIAWGATLW